MTLAVTEKLYTEARESQEYISAFPSIFGSSPQTDTDHNSVLKVVLLLGRHYAFQLTKSLDHIYLSISIYLHTHIAYFLPGA